MLKILFFLKFSIQTAFKNQVFDDLLKINTIVIPRDPSKFKNEKYENKIFNKTLHVLL